jgi:hypothetical protein
LTPLPLNSIRSWMISAHEKRLHILTMLCGTGCYFFRRGVAPGNFTKASLQYPS